MPAGFLVKRRAKGTKSRSYKRRPTITVRFSKMAMVAGGIWKVGERKRSIVRACWMLKLSEWEYAVMARIPADQIGNIRTMDLSSSTRWTVDSLHRFGGLVGCVSSESVITAALSSHLQCNFGDFIAVLSIIITI
ncbi:hypothetical protein CsSME_00039140 [Camellia sinensis var. sinensis]